MIALKAIRKYISVIAALAVMSAFAAFPVYAEGDDDIDYDVIDQSDEDMVEDIDSSDEESIDDDGEEGVIVYEDEGDDDDDGEIILSDDDDDNDDSGEGDDGVEILPGDDETLSSSNIDASYTAVSEYTAYASNSVRLRSTPDISTDSNIITTLYVNQEVTVDGTRTTSAGTWYHVSCSSGTGFVFSSYVSKTRIEIATPAQTPAVSPQPVETPPAETPQAAEIVDSMPPDAQTPDVETPGSDPAPSGSEQAVDTTAPAEDPEAAATKSDEDDDDKEAAGSTEENKKNGGIGGVLLALGCALGAFLLIGVVPVVIHIIRHKKLYQY